MKTTACVLYEMGQSRPYAESQPLKVEELDMEGPGEGEVLVEVRAAGLCHSDLSVIDGARPRPMPMAIGHEAAGVVREVGPGVADFAEGDHVVMIFVPSCGDCLPCAEGRPALCEKAAAANGAGHLLSGRRPFSKKGQAINHHMGVAAFSTYTVCSRRSLVKVDSRLPLVQAALFGCAVMTGVGAVLNTAQVAPGSSAAVIGLGGVGLNALLGTLLVGGHPIAIDLVPEKLELARQLGCSHAFDGRDPDLIDKVREVSGGGVDFAFEMAGSAPALELAYKLTRRGGTTVTAGLAHPSKNISIQAVSLVAEERTLKGSYIGSCVPPRDIPRYVGLFQNGRLPVDRLLSETLHFDEVNEAFDRLADGKSVRQILLPFG